jgi:hypothetical protein
MMLSQGNCLVTLVTADDKKVKRANVTIDHNKGTWTYTGLNERAIQTTLEHRIGEGYSWPNGATWGVIGVYDKTNMGHLRQMLCDAKDVVRDLGVSLRG